MPLDAVCLAAVTAELAPRAVGAKIDKIQQPARDQVVLSLRRGGRLLLCASPSGPRLHLTELLRDNPAQPPMFCMLLRKYLQGGVITALEQAPLERVVWLTVRAADELGEAEDYRLILEMMGRRTNLILCRADGHIVDCLRRLDLETSPQRQVLPGLLYRLPSAPDKRSPLAEGKEDFLSALSLCPEGETLDRWLVDTYTAVSPLVAREIVCRALGESDARRDERGEDLWRSFSDWQSHVMQKDFTPNVILRDGKPVDFTYFSPVQYGTWAACERTESFSALLDSFYEQREQAERVRQRGEDLLRTAASARDRVRRKLAAQEKELAGTRDRDRLRLWGELITANLYRMERGQARLTAPNYYEEGCPEVEIPLDRRLSPQANAARYFKQYAKAKTAERILTEQLEKGRAELTYLESVLQELSQAESELDFLDIRAELESGGYLRSRGGKRNAPKRASKPREFRSSAGLRILVGRSNAQNDELTCRTARRGDLWLHTQKIHGSHVILCTDGAEADERSVYEAAVLAAWFSQGRESGRVDVDYTPVRYVKKPSGSRPGMVIYTDYRTITVAPDKEMVKALAVK